MNINERLERLRAAKGLTWQQLGKLLDLSRGMLHYVRKGERGMSRRSLSRLEAAEIEMGWAKEPYSAVLEEVGHQVDQEGIPKEQKQALFSDVIDELGRLMETGVTPGEILRRLQHQETVKQYPQPKKNISSRPTEAGSGEEAARKAASVILGKVRKEGA